MKLIKDIQASQLADLLNRFGIKLIRLPIANEIPGSYWGAPEAGIILNKLYVRDDTPVHSALHESCHYICMDNARRQVLHTDTGGDYDEENGVCYLQIILANHLQNVSGDQLCDDMDTWGYTFRLGSAKKWFDDDAEDARDWLVNRNILDKNETPTWKTQM